MKKTISLASYFKPASYLLDQKNLHLIITGQKIGRPNKRISLHQKSLKVTGAKIIRHDKKGDQEIIVSRINHLRTFEQVRLHSNEILYPGNYSIELKYSLPAKFNASKPNRSWLPSVDEPEAWANASVEIKE